MRHALRQAREVDGLVATGRLPVVQNQIETDTASHVPCFEMVASLDVPLDVLKEPEYNLIV